MLSGNGSDSDSGENDEPKKIGNGSFSKFRSDPVYRSRGQVVRRIRRSGYVGPFHLGNI